MHIECIKGLGSLEFLKGVKVLERLELLECLDCLESIERIERQYWAYGCFFAFGNKLKTRLHVDIPFYFDWTLRSIFILNACKSKFNNIHYYLNYTS